MNLVSSDKFSGNVLSSYRSLVEGRNDQNNPPDPSDHDRQYNMLSNLMPDDHNKEVITNSTSSGSYWSKERYLDFKASNITCPEGIVQYLLICYQLFCGLQQAFSGIATYKYTVSSMVAVILTLDVSIQKWKELCNMVVVRYWSDLEAFCTLVHDWYLEELLNGEGKELWTITCKYYQSLCSTPVFPVVPQHCVLSHFDMSHAPCVLVANYNSLYDYATQCVTMFGSQLSDVALLLYRSPTRLLPVLSLDLFPCSHDCLHQIKSYSSGAGRQASDRSGGNGKRSQSESSKHSGSAGSNTNSSTTGGACYTGRTGLGGVSGGAGDSSGGDDEDDKDRRWYLEKPRDAIWEEDGEEDDNKDCSAKNSPTGSPADTAAKSTIGQKKLKSAKTSAKTAEPIFYEYTMKCGNGLYVFKVTSPMMDKPLSEDESDSQSIYVVVTDNSSTIYVPFFNESFSDKLLYSDDIPRTFKNLQILCLPLYCCEPAIAQASDVDVPLPDHATKDTEGVPMKSLLPPPGGGSDEQFKEVLMVYCTVVAAVYCYLYDDHCYFDRDDLHVDNIFVMVTVKTRKILSVNIHALLHHLEGVSAEPVKAATNEGLRSMAAEIYSQYRHTQHKDLAGVLAKMRQDHSYQSDLDMLHSLLVYHDGCASFTNNAIAFVR